MKKSHALKILMRSKKTHKLKDSKRKDPFKVLPVFELNPTQLLATKLVAQGVLKDSEIAEQCKISRQTLQKWKGMPQFMIEVKEKLDQYDKVDKETRVKLHKDLLVPMVTEFQVRIANGGLKKLKLTTLKNMIVDMGQELRLDSGEATSRTGTEDMDEVQKRFQDIMKEEAKKTELGKKRFKKTKVKEYYKGLGLGKVKKSKIKDVSHYFKDE